jgi:hypothetical protein
VATFAGDDLVCLDKNADVSGFRSKWQELIVPILNVDLDGTADISADPVAGTSVWLWTYTQPPPPAPTPGPPPDPCGPQPSGPSLTNGTAFRIGDGLLVDLALREYTLHDFAANPFARWNTFTAGTDVDGTPDVGKWMFSQDLQMQMYRGEITIVDAPSLSEKLDNPYGNWQAGPGQWYLRGRDKLSIVVYTGDLYMGNTGNGYHIPLTNGIFSTLAAIFNITWPS